MKPENILMSKDGYIKLADFGFVKRLHFWQRTYTLCGTPEYMAPEIILNTGYNQAVDWYALGIMLFELIYGRPPFMDKDPIQIMKQVTSKKILFPKDFDQSAKSLIKHLTEKDLSKRYGNLKDGINTIMNHRFFQGIDWDKLLSKEVVAPYISPVQVQQMNNIRKYSYYEMDEFNDVRVYPPIKVERDPFMEWF